MQSIQKWATHVASLDEVTIFVQNIHSGASKEDVMGWIDQSGLEGAYDFLYLPRCPVTLESKGHAFINFLDEDAAERFKQVVSTTRGGPLGALVATRSVVQGLSENLLMVACAEQARAHGPESLPYVKPAGVAGVVHPQERSGDVAESSVDRDSQSSAARGSRVAVTLVIKNLPSRCTPEDLLRLIQDSGYTGRFESLHMPLQPGGRRSRNKGYAFVAFATTEHAVAFGEAINGTSFGTRTSTKAVRVEVAVSNLSRDEWTGMTFSASAWGPVAQHSSPRAAALRMASAAPR